MELSKFPVIEGKFISRPNRFIAQVMVEENGAEREIKAHVANTGRMRELLTPGARVRMAFNPSPNRKTDFTLLTVWYQTTWVCIHSTMANALACEYMKGEPDVTNLRREVTYGKSRFDLAFNHKEKACLYEVKSANLVVGSTAMFPDAPTERGCKHLKELLQAQQEGYEAGVLFVVQREDAEFFTPNTSTDPLFSELLKKCYEKGVTIRALRCAVRENNIKIETEIPVRFNTSPDDEIIKNNERRLF